MAVSDIDKHRRRWEENPKGLTFAPYADALRKAGEAEQALDVLKAGLEHHPDYIPANIVLGRCHLDLGDDPSAEGAFERVLALDPENVIALKALADVSERGKRWERARRWLDSLLSIDRGNDAAREQMARVQMAELEHAQQAEAPTYPDAPQSDWAEVAAKALEGASAESTLQLETVETFAGADGDVSLAEGLVNRETVDASDLGASDSRGIELGAGVADAISLSVDLHDELAPSVEFIVEERHEDETQISLEAASGEFAIADASEALRAEESASEVAIDAETAWSDVGAGEYVPAIFADDASVAPVAEMPSVTDGVVLEHADATVTFDAAADAASVLSEHVADVMTVEPVSIESSADIDTVPAVVFESVAMEMADEAPLESADAPESSVMPEHEPVAETDAPLAVAAVSPVEVPSPVGVLALDASELLALEQRAREAVLEAFVARRSIAPVDVLGQAPTVDPAVAAALAVATATVADAPPSPELVESHVVWNEWTWGEGDPDLALLEVAEPEIEMVAEVPASVVEEAPACLAESDEVAVHEVPAVSVLDEVATEAPPVVSAPTEVPEVEVAAAAHAVVAAAEPSPFAPAAADVATDDEQGAVPPNFAAPVLVTAAMAALYEGQGHLREALATYRELESRNPGAHADRIAALEASLAAAAVPAPPVYAARLTGGQPAREFFGALLRTMPPALVRPTGNGAEDGSALRKAADPVSLGRLFGEESSAPRPRAVAARTASFDEFYGAAAAPAETGGRDDLESFHAWLQGLKT